MSRITGDDRGFRFDETSNYRDVLHIANCDDGVVELARLCGYVALVKCLETHSATSPEISWDQFSRFLSRQNNSRTTVEKTMSLQPFHHYKKAPKSESGRPNPQYLARWGDDLEALVMAGGGWPPPLDPPPPRVKPQRDISSSTHAQVASVLQRLMMGGGGGGMGGLGNDEDDEGGDGELDPRDHFR